MFRNGLFAIYVGKAKYLALNPPTSEWGRLMLAKRGGKAVQRKYRLEGRHPTEKATWARLADLKIRKGSRTTQASGPASCTASWIHAMIPPRALAEQASSSCPG
jgi:hypothetical protein